MRKMIFAFGAAIVTPNAKTRKVFSRKSLKYYPNALRLQKSKKADFVFARNVYIYIYIYIYTVERFSGALRKSLSTKRYYFHGLGEFQKIAQTVNIYTFQRFPFSISTGHLLLEGVWIVLERFPEKHFLSFCTKRYKSNV